MNTDGKNEEMRNQLNTFFNGLTFYSKIFEKSQKRINRYFANQFNVFDYIQPNENKITTIIAELLHPQGNHGQGTLFLKHFLAILTKCNLFVPYSFLKDIDPETVTIEKEVCTRFTENPFRRIDLLITLDNFGIGIENKPWALEQNNQLNDYNEELKKRFADNYLLLFLSPLGVEPTSIDENKRKVLEASGTFGIIHYTEQIIDWLDLCLNDVEADKVKWFIKDFKGFILTEYNNIRMEENG